MIRNKPIKIRSFTLVDVLSGMVITSIIIGLVFSLFTIVNQQLYDFAKTRTELNEFLILKADLKRTFFDSNLPLKEVDKVISFVRYDSKIKILESEMNLLRFTDQWVDTLSKSLEKIELIKLKGEGSDAQTIIEGIHLEVYLNNNLFECDFYRPVDFAKRINKMILNGV